MTFQWSQAALRTVFVPGPRRRRRLTSQPPLKRGDALDQRRRAYGHNLEFTDAMKKSPLLAGVAGAVALVSMSCSSENALDATNAGIAPANQPAATPTTPVDDGTPTPVAMNPDTDPMAMPAAGGTPAIPEPGDDVPAAGGSGPVEPMAPVAMGGAEATDPVASGGTGGMPEAPSLCGAGFAEFEGDCVSEAAVCGETVCGIGQTCADGACTAPSPTVVVEAENFAYRFNPGNSRTWYTLVQGRDVPWVEGNNTVGFPCQGDRCEDSSPNNLEDRGGNGIIEIMPDQRRAHGDPMAAYCGGLTQGCDHPMYDAHIRNAAGFPGYRVTTTHENAEFYPVPGEGPGIGYRVQFIQAGTYRVFDLGGRANPESNSWHVGISRTNRAPDVANGETWPEGTWETNGRGLIHCTNGWTWSNVRRNDPTGEACSGANITINVPTPGIYTVWFTMREDGYQVDKWIATLDDATPSGNEQPEVGRVELEGGLDAQPGPDCVGCEVFEQ